MKHFLANVLGIAAFCILLGDCSRAQAQNSTAQQLLQKQQQLLQQRQQVAQELAQRQQELLAQLAAQQKQAQQQALQQAQQAQQTQQKQQQISQQQNNQTPVNQSVSALQNQVVQFALSCLGKATSEPGQPPNCATFVTDVLDHVGAKNSSSFQNTGGDNYAWGTLEVTLTPSSPISSFNKVQPGDILQFANAAGTMQGGTWSAAHHTAIVYQNLGGGKLVLLEQNVNNQQFVTKDTYDYSKMTQGTIWVYQPVPK
jgi:exonuclease VII large subunit